MWVPVLTLAQTNSIYIYIYIFIHGNYRAIGPLMYREVGAIIWSD
jgi:hypothetical protein